MSANPISPSIKAIAANMMIANRVIASAFSHPQSKKCLIMRSQSISWMTAATKPVNIAPKSEPTTVPTTIIQMASVNFAFSFPTSALPASQRTGERIMTFTITFTKNDTISSSRLTAKVCHLFWVRLF